MRASERTGNQVDPKTRELAMGYMGIYTNMNMKCNVKCDRNWPGAGPGPAKGWKLSECHGNGQLGQGYDKDNFLVIHVSSHDMPKTMGNNDNRDIPTASDNCSVVARRPPGWWCCSSGFIRSLRMRQLHAVKEQRIIEGKYNEYHAMTSQGPDLHWADACSAHFSQRGRVWMRVE